jgi:membrane-associated phospholipid phosphatase
MIENPRGEIEIRMKICLGKSMPVLGLLLLSFVIVANPVLSQENQPRTYRLNTQFLKDLKDDFVSVWTAPFKWRDRDLTKFAVVLGSTALIYSADNGIHDWSQTSRSESGDDFWGFIASFGEPLILLGISGGIYAAGEIAGSTGMRRTALLSIESLLISSTMLYALKWAVGRARPYTEEGKSSFHPFSLESKYHSFPSGHTTAAFSVASVIAHHSDSLIVDILSYSLATFVAFARPFQDKHWASDVFFGAALGYFVGQKICACHIGQASNNIDVGLLLTPHQQGLTFSFSF